MDAAGQAMSTAEHLPTMKALMRGKYGDPGSLAAGELQTPVPGDDVLVEVVAAAGAGHSRGMNVVRMSK